MHRKRKVVIRSLTHEKEELEERIDRLHKEREEVDEEIERIEIEEIIDGLKCPKDFNCYRTNYEELCKAEFVRKTKLLYCLEKNPTGCKFSLLNEDKYYCQCPLRIYIAAKLAM